MISEMNLQMMAGGRLPSPLSEPLTHHSKFFLLDAEPQSIVSIVSKTSSNARGRRGRGHVNNIQAPILSNKAIPDIKDWFIGLSVDDRVACFTIIDDHWADTV